VKAAALRALELDDTLAEAHTSLAQFKERYEWNWAEAEKEYKRATQLNPNYARAFQWYGFLLVEQGRFDEALASITHAQKLDPLTPFISANRAFFHYIARQSDEAIAQLQQMIKMDPNFLVAHYTLGLAYVQKGMFEQAVAELNEAQRLDPEAWAPTAFLAQAYAAWGKRDEAEKRLEDLKRSVIEKHIDPYNIGVIHAALGEKDHAFEWFEKAYGIRSEEMLFLKVDPRVDKLRSDPRYLDLLRRLNLAP
jgi:Flp pilus assembly protein TadD